ncbi:ribonuclease T2-like [Thoreauomyces humboldtii]|nr:ribonuclease T2-like [Thoreauomyces humboldtii]
MVAVALAFAAVALPLAAAKCLPSGPIIPFPPVDGSTCPTSAVGCTLNPATNQSYASCCLPDQGLLVFSQNWTTGYCTNPNNTCADSILHALPKKEWTMHGLWPDYCNGTYNTSPLGCDPVRRDVNVLDTLAAVAPKSWIDKLKSVWMGADGDYNWFWSHEWNKHGTCLSTLNPTCFKNPSPQQDKIAFIDASLALRERFSLYDIFAKHDIVPSPTKNYTIAQFQAALVAETGFQGALQCQKVAGKAYLSELWMYLVARPGLKFDNHAPVLPYSSCPVNGTILYLPQKF